MNGNKKHQKLRVRWGLLLLALALPVLLGGWQDISGKTINPRFVERIKDGVTNKHDILLWFGDPKEVERTPEGPVFKYFSYRDAPLAPSKLEYEPEPQSSVPFLLDDDKKVKKVKPKREGKILDSTLTVRFKADGETVMSHEFKQVPPEK
jgi:hypothetical protein